jgi:hypothetical protein
VPNQRAIKNPLRAIKARNRETNWIFQEQNPTPVPPPPPTVPFFTFVTDFVGVVSFNITKTGTPADWNMGDGTGYLGTNSVTHTFTTPGPKTVTINVDAFVNVSTVGTFSGKNILEVYFSDLTNLGGSLIFDYNPGLTILQLPATSNVIGPFLMRNTGFAGPLDLSMLSNLSNSIQISNSPVTSVALPSTTQLISFVALSCNLTGTLDLTPLSNLWVDCVASFNPLLTAVNINTPQPLTQFRFNSCNLTGVLNLTNVPNISNEVFLQLNPLLTSVLFVANSTPINVLDISQCALNGTFNISMLQLQNYISLRLNIALRSILFPTTGNLFSAIYLDGCNLGLGGITLAPMTNISGIFHGQNQVTRFTDSTLIFAGNSNNFTDFRVHDNLLNNLISQLPTLFPNLLALDNSVFRCENNAAVVTRVNACLQNADANTAAGPINRVLNIAGTGNAAPTGAGITAKNNLIAKGVNVTTN